MDVKHRITSGWIKWREASGVLWECWVVDRIEQSMSVAEMMRMLRWMSNRLNK